MRSFLFSAGLTVLGGLFGLALRGVAAMLLFGASGLVIGVLFSRSGSTAPSVAAGTGSGLSSTP